jgi:hypothetical protein
MRHVVKRSEKHVWQIFPTLVFASIVKLKGMGQEREGTSR